MTTTTTQQQQQQNRVGNNNNVVDEDSLPPSTKRLCVFHFFIDFFLSFDSPVCLSPFLKIEIKIHARARENRKCELDLEDTSDNVINYKKLVKEQTGISVKEQKKHKEEKRGGDGGAAAAAGEKERDGGPAGAARADRMLETNGGGGHMAAVIRRIEALYQGGVQAGDDSDSSSSEESSEEEESEEEEESDDGEEDGEKGEGEEDGSEDDDDDDDDDDSSGSEMEDDHPMRTPGGTLVAPSSKEKKANRDKGAGGGEENANNDEAAKSAPGSDEKQEKKKKTKKKDKSNKRRRRGDIDWYDVDDDWIDDEELDEYFDRDGRKTKHSGFFVNKGEIQNVNADGTTPVKGEVELTYKQKEQLRLEAEARGERVCGRGFTISWTEAMLNALKEAVEEFGHAWAHIVNLASTTEKYAPLIGLSKDQMTRKWMNMREEMIAKGIEPPAAFVSSVGTKVSNPTIGRRPQPIGEWKPEDENDPELVEIVISIAKLAQIFSGKINDDANEFGLGNATRTDKQEKLNSKIEEFCMRAPKELFSPFLSRAMVMYLLTQIEFVWTEKTLRDKMNKYFRTANPGYEPVKPTDEEGGGAENATTAGFSSPNTRSVRPTPSNSARPTPMKAASRSPAVAVHFDETSNDWMTDTWKKNFEEFKKRCEICHANIQKSKKPNEWVFDTDSTEAFLKLVKTQFQNPGNGPGKGKFSSIVYAAAVKAIPEMYNMHVANMRNKYSNEKQKVARMVI